MVSRELIAAEDVLGEFGLAEDMSFCGSFTEPAERAVLAVPQVIMAAWAANDADLFAAIFTENGSLLMRDEQLTSREQIRAYMARGFGHELQGARVTGWPLKVMFVSDATALVVTQGGIILRGETSIAPEREIRAIWTVVTAGGSWRLLSHHSCPVR
jgi:uncharacterized protein (TIGR02246 family)